MWQRRELLPPRARGGGCSSPPRIALHLRRRSRRGAAARRCAAAHPATPPPPHRGSCAPAPRNVILTVCVMQLPHRPTARVEHKRSGGRGDERGDRRGGLDRKRSEASRELRSLELARRVEDGGAAPSSSTLSVRLRESAAQRVVLHRKRGNGLGLVDAVRLGEVAAQVFEHPQPTPRGVKHLGWLVALVEVGLRQALPKRTVRVRPIVNEDAAARAARHRGDEAQLLACRRGSARCRGSRREAALRPLHRHRRRGSGGGH